MHFDRRHFLALTAGLAALPLTARLAAAEEMFAQFRFFVPANPGGGWDQTARTMEQVLRQTGLIGTAQVTNVGGAGGIVGLPQFINQWKGQGDGLMIGGLVMVGAIIANKAPVNLSMTTPIARLTGEAEVIVVPKESPFQTLADLIAALKADTAAVSWAGGSAGGTDHITAGLVAQAAGADPTKVAYVAYSGGGEAQAAILGNQVSCGISGWGEFSEQVAAGNMRALGISSGTRVAGIDVPTFKEQGVDVEFFNWRGVFAPPEISADDEAKLVALLDAMVASDAWKAECEKRGWTQIYLKGDEFAASLESEIARTEAILKTLGLA
ncbi:Bug family tripartite tricarboxylate transporter substrate binding protein [Methylobrevis albus]|uniref:Tripartite tricarboxylate transporter substrate binding protein n=1 Tax=Methylobrevis albus TaxID=2793297 RepID=A0A931MZ71_9HYPH|nr:tripartite tricarboxylate transporter substrate-binding protein [Methylobrevis albus]MBH0237714.1 tripartite tricarboxylate transporter substrate binding protein [Methylobrevis albus]